MSVTGGNIGVVSKPQPAFATAPAKPSDGQAAIVPVVVSVALFGSPPPKTLALLVSVPVAVSATATGNVNVLDPAAAIAVVEVQVAVSLGLVVVERTHVQAAALDPPGVNGAPNDMPAGKISLTVVVPLVAAEPVLFTVNVYVPAEPAVKLAALSSLPKERFGFCTQKPKAAKPTNWVGGLPNAPDPLPYVYVNVVIGVVKEKVALH